MQDKQRKGSHSSQFISVKIKKVSRKSKAQFLVTLRKLRLRQNDGFRIKRKREFQKH